MMTEQGISVALDMSMLAYQDPADIEAALEGHAMGFTWFDNDETGTQAFVCEDDNAAWVAFRGTEFEEENKFQDAMTDLDIKLVPGPYGLVHRGFYRAMRSVAMDIDARLLRYRLSGKNIKVTGHSLGGGLSNLYCARASAFNNPVTDCITFGGPRSMSKEAAARFGAAWGTNIYSVVNNNDIVTRIPPRVFNYGHVPNAHLQYLTEDMEIKHDPSFWFKFMDRVKGRIYDFGELGTDGVKDHPGISYRTAWPGSAFYHS